MTAPRRGRGKAKFYAGEIVMVRQDTYAAYPVKLVKRTGIGRNGEPAWFDTLNNVEYESQMRKQTRRERGKGQR